MKCPKCGNEMKLGKVNILYGGIYATRYSVPFWAEKSYFTRATFPNAKDAEKQGVGFAFPTPKDMIDVAYSNLPDAYACQECKVVVLDCNS